MQEHCSHGTIENKVTTNKDKIGGTAILLENQKTFFGDILYSIDLTGNEGRQMGDDRSLARLYIEF